MIQAYYNEIDPRAAAWLRELIAQGHIAPGIVDERSIIDVRPSDLAGFAQCHFFAGIGVWSGALRRAGWSDDRNVWTGSCPCQPFSAAGGKNGFTDERHLWPEFFRLIRECRPSVVFGEQVASPLGLDWLDTVSSDLEGAGYAFGSADLCAAGVGAPHIRQRLYFVADAADERLLGRRASSESSGRGTPRLESERLCDAGELAHADDAGSQGRRREELCERADQCAARASGASIELADANGDGCDQRREREPATGCDGLVRDGAVDGLADTASGRLGVNGCAPRQTGHVDERGPTNGFWRDADWLRCTDGKWRSVEPGTFPLANGAPARVGRLRGYGNAIVLTLACEFITSYEEARR